MISVLFCRTLATRRSFSQFMLTFVWMLYILSTEVSTNCLLGNNGSNCSNETNVTCLSSGCTNGTSDFEDCDDGFYGSNCTFVCSRNCTDQLCDQVTGECRNGCQDGYQGDLCNEVCSKGFYGHKCGKKCPENCASNQCHQESGQCLDGCKAHFWGSDCSKVVDVRNNSEQIQHKFYSHLSAESKSLLLYVLMGKYEETLERAQMEINRGIQQRNELRSLMGGGSL